MFLSVAPLRWWHPRRYGLAAEHGPGPVGGEEVQGRRVAWEVGISQSVQLFLEPQTLRATRKLVTLRLEKSPSRLCPPSSGREKATLLPGGGATGLLTMLAIPPNPPMAFRQHGYKNRFESPLNMAVGCTRHGDLPEFLGARKTLPEPASLQGPQPLLCPPWLVAGAEVVAGTGGAHDDPSSVVRRRT